MVEVRLQPNNRALDFWFLGGSMAYCSLWSLEMKALLVESKDLKKINHRSAIILLPSGKVELGLGDPASIIIESDDDSHSVRILSANDFASFRVVKEVEISGRFLLAAIEYRNIRIDYERAKVEFKDKLLRLMITPNCDALSFLDIGSVIL